MIIFFKFSLFFGLFQISGLIPSLLDLVQLYLVDLVQLYLVDLVQRLWPAGRSVAEEVDLVQHMELDLVQLSVTGQVQAGRRAVRRQAG